jgi:hypothetical protein
MSFKEEPKPDNYLCTLTTGRDIFKGDVVFRTELQTHAIADYIWVDSDGDRYLCFEEMGNAWIDGPLNGEQRLK